jgi:tRNA U34 5-methylaminomethyl-2-thiouridine-forming methyltransferase MnmC
MPRDALALLPPPPDSCQRFVTSSTSIPLPIPEPGRCLILLASALAEPEPQHRDAALASLEACPEFAPGLLRALRAELVPVVCADLLTEPLLAAPLVGQSRGITEVLEGLALGAKLARIPSTPPALPEDLDRAAYLSAFRLHLAPWFLEQANAIGELSRRGARLSSYAKAVVAVRAGLADLAFVEAARSLPLPKELAGSAELVEAYQLGLEDALAPRKERGRDALLVAFSIFSEWGILEDPRLREARSKLTTLYAGSRIDALSQLLLPELPATGPEQHEHRLAGALPTFYANELLPPELALSPATLDALTAQGLPPRHRARLESSALSMATLESYARLLVELGRRYFRPADFARARDLLLAARPTTEAERDRFEHLAGIAEALQNGPRDTITLMLNGPLLPVGMGDTTRLDRLGTSRSSLAGHALFNAAHIRSIAHPALAATQAWEGILRRFERASQLLLAPELRKLAALRADEARSTLRAIAEEAEPASPSAPPSGKPPH